MQTSSLGLRPPSGPVGNPPAGGSRPTEAYTIGGMVSVKPLRQLLAEEEHAARARAQAANNQPVVLSLASHIRHFFSVSSAAKRDVETRILDGLRALRGEYPPDKLAQLRQQDSPEIYMMLFASKARQYKALLGDVVLGSGDDKPWSLKCTPDPTLPPDAAAEIMHQVYEEVLQAEQVGQPMNVSDIRTMAVDTKNRAEALRMKEARDRACRAETKLEDMLLEGGFTDALDQVLDDMTVSPTAFLKGPVMRRRAKLVWEETPNGYEPRVENEIEPHWERRDPLNIYPAPWAPDIRTGPLIDRHKLTAQQLADMIGVEGYNDDVIREILQEYGINGLHDWLSIDTERASAEGRDPSYANHSDTIDALQYWGPATGKQLREWGMTEADVPDEAKVYEIEAWLIGRWVFRAVINPDPLARRGYYAVSFRPVPGSVWGQSLHDTVRDVEAMCNAAARALAANMAIASGPQVWINVDRVPQSEELSTMFPWKLWQTTSDPAGSTAAPMGFFQPSSNASELMAVYERYSQLADEYTGIPRYMTGDGNVGGAGRTASGMSMMVGNAGKTVKSAVQMFDKRVIAPAVQRAYEHLMVYYPDPDLKGDLQAVARGALSLMTKEAAQVRRNEFLTLALQSDKVHSLIGDEGLASLLRASTRGLELDSASIVPSTTEVRVQQRVAAAQQQQALMMQAAAAQQQQQIKGPTASAELANGAPVTDNFGA